MKINYLAVLIFLFCIFLCSSCKNDNKTKPTKSLTKFDSVLITDSLIKFETEIVEEPDTYRIYTEPSKFKNRCDGFNSVKAINKIAEIENEYFNNFKFSLSKYYGSVWYLYAKEVEWYCDTASMYQCYKTEIKRAGVKRKMMHCTIYGEEALKGGFGKEYSNFMAKHRAFWGDDQPSGWSVAKILTDEYGWKAVLVLTPESDDFKKSKRNFENKKLYDVWRQPDVPISECYNKETQTEQIDSMLSKHEFAWGFSDQGCHTWITRFDTLKECMWDGAPSRKFSAGNEEGTLFRKTKFTEFTDYWTHIIVFPSEKKS